MPRPAVDVVVPFLGDEAELSALCERLSRLTRRPGDTLLVVDNRPHRPAAPPRGPEAVAVLHAAARQTPGYARNRGAERGRAPWIVFFDADTEPSADLLDRLFAAAAASDTGLLAGAVRDEPVPYGGPGAGRYCYLRAAMSQEDTLRLGRWGFPKSANLAVRREAFEAVGGFREDIRAGEDADLCYRMRAAGWRLERRERAAVVHRSRASLGSFARQKLIHGAGGAWLERNYPGSFPPRRRVGMLWWAVRTLARGTWRAARRRDRDEALWAVFEPVEGLAWEFGRSLPNERPLGPRVCLQALRRLRRPA